MADVRRFPVAVRAGARNGSRVHVWLPVAETDDGVIDGSADGTVQALCGPSRSTSTRLRAVRAELDPAPAVDCVGCLALLTVLPHVPRADR